MHQTWITTKKQKWIYLSVLLIMYPQVLFILKLGMWITMLKVILQLYQSKQMPTHIKHMGRYFFVQIH